MNKTFEELEINKKFIEKLESLNIKSPSAVQEQVIPLIKQNKNIMFQSETGTGKTFAYLLPILQKIESEKSENSENSEKSQKNQKSEIKLMIVCPTYELSSQIKSQIQSISSLKTVLCIGGSPIARQIEMLKEKPDIVVGGSARLLELIHIKKLKPESIEVLVLDEADRLLSKEMREETIKLLERLPKKIQLIGNSATVSDFTRKTLENARNGLKNDKTFDEEEKIQFVSLPQEDVLRKRISHWAIWAEQRDKIDTLRSFINAVDFTKMIVFTKDSNQIGNIVSKLRYKKIECEGLSSKLDKKERKTSIDRFKSGKIKILVTSDLSSRGLDINNISHVVQLDLPENDDFFIHRAGRTARAGSKGINCVIGDEYEMKKYSQLEKRLKIAVYPKIIYKGKICAPEDLEN